MIDPQPHTIGLIVLAWATVLICVPASRNLARAALVLAGGFGLIVFAQLVLGWREPMLTALTSLCDLAALIMIGKAVVGRKWPSGVHLAGVSMCISIVAHPAYYFVGGDATFAYFVITNIAMGVACLGLIGSGLAELVGRHAGADNLGSGGASGLARVDQRREAQSWTRR